LKIERSPSRWLIELGFRLLQIWARTIRYQLDDRGAIAARPLAEHFIGALWHNRLLLLPSALQRFFPRRHGAALISASRDGAWLAALVERFGYEVVRGSSSRKGTVAMLQLAETLASGKDVVITPDGPRGPAYELGPGIVFLAQQSGAAVVPINMEYSGCWRLKSWDRFILPRPFSKVRVILGAPHHIISTSTDTEFEQERTRLHHAMMQLVERK